jgi:predicted nucleic acid-binding protein
MEDEVICLDTNYLIRGLVAGAKEAEELQSWYRSGEALVTPMPAWYEFLCGPVTAAQTLTLRAFLKEIIPFHEPQANEAARLFNAVDRRRALRVDAMIAGTAIAAGARLATNNRADFSHFVHLGLQLV